MGWQDLFLLFLRSTWEKMPVEPVTAGKAGDKNTPPKVWKGRIRKTLLGDQE